MALKNNSSTLIALRIPNELLDRLPGPTGDRTGKAGTGRAGVIVNLLRKALEENRPESDDSSPACSYN